MRTLSSRRRPITIALLAATAAILVFFSSRSFSQESIAPAPAGSWVSVAPLLSARVDASSAALPDGSVLVVGGGESGSVSAELLQGREVPAAAPPMALPRRDHTAVALRDGRVLVFGGVTADSGPTNSAEIYDPSLRTWYFAGPMVEARSRATATLLLDGRVLIAGGELAGGTASNTAEVFDPATNAFSFAGALSSRRMRHAAALLAGGRVLIAGGSDGATPLATTDIFDPATKSTAAGPAMSSARSDLTATALFDDSVLIAGGQNQTGDLDTAELLAPSGDRFVKLEARLSAARSGHFAILLPRNGNVLIGGGASGGTVLASAELFQPAYGSHSAAGSFIPTAPMKAPRTGAIVAALPQEGQLMVAGGRNASGALVSAEVYGFSTLAADKPAYGPGESVILTGAGWQPGEEISLAFRAGAIAREAKTQAGRDGRVHYLWQARDEQGAVFAAASDSISRAFAPVHFAEPLKKETVAKPAPAPARPALVNAVPQISIGPAQASQAFASGTLIIPMDTDTTGNHSSYNQDLGMFKAYGLLYKLLSSNIPVSWGIQLGKAYNGTDFSVSSVKDKRTGVLLSSWSYKGGPFIIDSSNAAAALPIIQAWWAAKGNLPNVHEAQASFTANVDVVLRSAPRIATESTNASIAMAYYNAAGITDLNGNAWSSTSPNILTEAQIAAGGLFQSGSACLSRKWDTFVTPHNSGYSYSLTDPTNLGTKTYSQLDTFVNQGGGWTALCHSILSNENSISDLTRNGSSGVKSLFKTSLAGGQPGGFLTTTGFSTIDNTSGTWTVADPQLPIAQSVATTGATQALPGGSVQTWPGPGNTGAPTYYSATERVDYFGPPLSSISHDHGIAGPYHNGTGLGKLTFIGGHSFSTTIPYSSNFESPYLREFYDSLFFNGSAVAKIELTSSPSAYPVNGTGSLYASIVNSGGSTASNVGNVSVTLASGVTYVATTSGPAPSVSGQVLTWSSLGSVAGGQTAVTVQLSVSNALTSTAGVKQFATFHATYGDIFGEGFTADTCREFTVAAVPTLTKTPASQGPTTAGQQVTWTLTYANPGSTALYNAVLQDTLPAGFTFVSGSGSPTALPGSPTVVKWNLGTLAANSAGGSVTLTALAGAVTSGTGDPLTQTFTNNATLSGTDSSGAAFTDPAAASATVTVQKLPLDVSKAVDLATITTTPQIINYTIRPTYTGTLALNGLRVLDPNPAPSNMSFGTAGQGGSVGAYSPLAAADGSDGTPTTSIALTTDKTTVATGGTVTVTMTMTTNDIVTAISPGALTPSDGVSTCGAASPASASISTAGGGTATFTYTCTMAENGEATFAANAASGTYLAAPYDFPNATSPTVLTSPSGSNSVAMWNLGSTTAAVNGSATIGGTGPGLYAFRGGANTFWRYDIGTDTWSTMSNFSATAGVGSALAWDGGTFATGYVYGLQGNGSGLSKYQPSSNGSGWTTLATTPSAVGDGGALSYLGGTLYALRGNNTTGFFSYATGSNTWTDLSTTNAVPGAVKSGGALANDGTYVYALRGNGQKNLYRYQPGTGWTTKSSAGTNVKAGGTLVRIGTTLYATAGNSTQTFMAYTISTDKWANKANVPTCGTTKVGGGAAAATDGTYLYLMSGNAKQCFYKYSTTSNTWVSLANTPATVGTADGGALVYVPGSTTGQRKLSASVSPLLAIGGDTATVTVTVNSSEASTSPVALGTLTQTATGGVSATCTGPTPANATLVAGVDSTFTYSCTLTAGSAPGDIKFGTSIDTNNLGGLVWNNIAATSNNVLVTPPLTLSATVNSIPASNQIANEVFLATSDGSTANSSPVTTTIPSPVLTIQKTTSPSSTTVSLPGDTITYTISVQNIGSGSATNVFVTDPVPTNTVYESCSGATSCANSSGTVTWNVGTLTAGQTTTLTLVVNAATNVAVSASNYTITNTASVTSTQTSAVSASATNLLKVAPSITKTASVESAAFGNTITYTLAVTNPGAQFTGTITDTIPTGTTFAGVGSCTPACTLVGSTVTWSSQTIPTSGATFSFGVTVTASGGSVIANTASITPSGQTAISSNEVDTPVGPVLGIVKTQSPITSVTTGDTITYTMVISNESGVAATSTVVTDALPAGTSYLSCSTSQGTCSQALGLATWNLGTLVAFGSATVSMSVQVASLPAGTLQINNTAQISASNSSSSVSSNMVTNAVTGAASLSLLLTKSASPATYTIAGNVITYSYTLTNIGNSVLTGPFAVTDNKATVTCTQPGTLAVGASTTCSATYTITASDVTSGSVTNTASATASGGITSNTATATVRIANRADISITKSDASTTYSPGTNVTYTITADNLGPSDNAGFTVTDTIPAGTTFVSASSGCANASGVVTCTSAGLTANSVTAWTITIGVPSNFTGSLANTAQIATNNTTDPSSANNSSTDTDTKASLADLQITNDDGALTYTPGGTRTYTVVVTNAGPSDVTGATVAFPMPSGSTATWTATGASGPTFTASGTGAISDTVNLPSGATITYTVVVTIPSGQTGNYTTTATVTAPAGVTDPTPLNNSASDTDSQSSSADLVLTKTDSSATYTPGTNVTYTIGVVNHGPSDNAGYTVTDTIPSGTTFVSAAAGCVNASGTVTCTSTGLTKNASESWTITVAVPGDFTGSLANTAQIATSTTTDPDLTNNTATDTDTQTSSADLVLTKSDASATYTPGTNVAYSIGVTNNGPSSNTGFTVTDTIPAGTTFVSASAGCVNASGTVTCTSAGLAKNGATTWTITVGVPSSFTGSLANTAQIATTSTPDPTASNNSATDTDTQSSSADLRISNTDGTTTYTPGDTRTYTVVVTNDGPSDVTGAAVSFPIPSGMTAVWTATGLGGAAGFTVDGTGTIADTVTLPAGASIRYSVIVSIPAGQTGAVTTTATVTAPAGVTDPTPANNTASDTDTQSSSADLAVTKTDSSATYTPGTDVAYTIGVSNAGPSNSGSFTVADTIPTGTTFVSASAGCVNVSGTVTCTSTGLNNGANTSWTVTIHVPSGFTGSLANTAHVASSTTPDPNAANDSATDTDTQSSSADLRISNTDGSATYTPGASRTYTVVVTNEGPSDVTGAAVAYPLPSGATATWTATSSGGANGYSASGSGSIADSVTMPSGSTITYSVVVSYPASQTGAVTTTATVSTPAGVTDPTPANNTAADTDTQASAADLAVSKTDGATTYTPGTNVSYTIGVTNNGPSNNTGFTVTDTIPAGTSFVSAAAGCSNSSGTVTCTSTGLNNGASTSWTITIAVPSSFTGALANTAQIASNSTADPNAANDSATDSDTQASRADLRITDTDGTTTYTPGGSRTYTVVVTNAGPSDVTGAGIAFPLPSGVTATWTATASGGATGFSASGSGDINDTATIPAGATITYTIVAAIPAAQTGSLTTTATVTAPAGVTDPTPANNTASDTDTPASSADLALTKTDSSATYTPGADVTYTLGVTNNGPSNNGGFTVTDTIPAGTSFVSASAGCANAAGTVTCTSAGLNNAASTSWTITINVPSGFTGNLANTAQIATTATPDPTPGNNTATDTDAQASRADLRITNSDGSVSYTPGGTRTYTVVVTNGGPSDVTGATVAYPLPSGATATWTAVAAGGATGFTASGSGNIGDTVAMPAGSTITYTVVVSIPAGQTGPFTTTGTVAAPAGVTDPTPANNTSSDTDTQASSADLAVTKTDSSATYAPGANVSYTIRVTNNGPSANDAFTVTDVLPAGTGFVSASPGCVNAAGTVTCSSTGLSNGASTTWNVTISVPSNFTGNLVNTAQIASSNTPDPDSSNNSATDTDTKAAIADLQITDSDGTTTYPPGGTRTYTVVATNAGPSDVTGAIVSFPLPSGATATWTATGTSGTVSAASGSGSVNDTVTIPSGGSIAYSVTVTIPGGQTGAFTTTATITAPAGVTDPTPANNTASDTDTQSNVADLAVTKSDSSTTYTPGTNVTYAIGVVNNGPSSNGGFTVTDVIPAGTSFVSASAGCSQSAGTVTCTSAGLANGASTSWTVTIGVPSGFTGALANTAQIATNTTADPDPSNNTATDTDTKASAADLQITDSDGATTYTPGGTRTYTVVVTNAGPSDATGAAVTFALPAGVTATWTASGTSGTTFSASGSGSISDTVTIPAGATITYTIVATIPFGQTGALTTTAAVAPPAGVTDPTPANNTASDTDTPASTADLVLTKTDSSATYTPGTNVSYTIGVTNNGPSNNGGFTVTETIPAGTNLVSASAGCANSSGTVTCTSAGLNNGASTSWTITISVPSSFSGNLVNSAAIATNSTPDPVPGNNSATDTDTKASIADLQITDSDGVATYVPGGTRTYTVVVTNAGPSDVAGAAVSLPVPSGVTLAWTATGSGGTNFTAAGSGAIADTVNIPAGATITYTVVATIPPGQTGTLTTVATVATPVGVTDPTPANNTASDSDTQAASADLVLTKTDGSTTYTPGTNVTYTIRVTNNGPSANGGFTVSDIVPAGTSFVSASAGCANVSGTVTCSSAGLTAGSSASWTITIAVPSSFTGSLSNTAQIASSTTSDPDPSNNSATDVDTKASVVDLQITNTDGATTYTPGATRTYTVVVTNAGPSDVTGGTVTFPLPPGATATWTAAGGSGTSFTTSGSGAINDTVGIPSGSSITYTVVVNIPAGQTGSLTTTATVAAPAGVTDPTPANNSASDTDTQADSADLAVTKSDSSSTYTPGTNVSYVIGVTNNGPSNNGGFTLSDTLPAGTSFVSASAGCGNTSGAVTCASTGLNSGASTSWTITIAVPSTFTGSLANTAQIATNSTPDPTPSNNSATDTDSQASSADLRITNTDGTTSYTPGGTRTYTVVVTNAGPSAAFGAAVAFPLPAGVTATWTASGTSGTVLNASGSGAINESVTMPSGASITYTIVATIAPSVTGSLTTTATVTAPAGVTDPTPANNSASDTDTQASVADLRISNTDGTPIYTAGGTRTYTVVVTNDGPSNVTGAAVAFPLPAGLTATWTASASGGATGFSATGAGSIGDTVNMPAGSTITYTVVASIPISATGALTTTARVTAPAGVTDPTPANNTASDTDVDTAADLSISKTHGSVLYSPGSDITYSIGVTNQGPTANAGFVVRDVLPAGATFVSASSGCTNASGTITCSSAGLPAAGSTSWTVTAHVDSSATGCLSNTASIISSNTYDPVAANNSVADVGSQLALTPQSSGLNLVLGVPTSAGNNTTVGATSYTAASKLFSLTSTPATFRFSSTDTSHVISGSPTLRVQAMVDNTGLLIGGVSGNDLVVTGTVSDGTTLYSGTLLTGEIVRFGFRELGSIDRFELQFRITGGTLAGRFQSKDIGIVITAESSTFTGSFATNFASGGKFTLGSLSPTCPY